MFRDEDSMLQLRLDAFQGVDVQHVLVEAPWTHRGIPKPLHFTACLQGTPETNAGYLDDLRIRHVIDGWEPDLQQPWNNEHHQRNQAWKVIDAEAADSDWVLICDVDEIPSRPLLEFLAAGNPEWQALSVPMRTFLFAVDWEVAVQVPPTCVAARAGFLRGQAPSGRYLAEVRDDRDRWMPFPDAWAMSAAAAAFRAGGTPKAAPKDGGWHFSWCGGPEAQAAKLDTATCHTEILRTPEAGLIRSGARYRTAANGGGLPVRPVDVDGTWPGPIARREVPAELVPA